MIDKSNPSMIVNESPPRKGLWQRIKLRYSGWAWYTKIIFWLSFIIGLHLLYIISLILVFPPITSTQLNSMIENGGISRDYIPLKKISANAVLAVIGAEDQIFMEHYGFDMESIDKAREHNKNKPKRLRGASTISQQVAKNVFLWQGRSWFRKGLEVYFTLMIETLWSKKRIMEMYLNVIEMGEGVFGIQAAAKKYFNTDAINLSREQAAMLAASLPNPKKYKLKPLSTYVTYRMPWVLQQMDQLEPDINILGLMHRADYHIYNGPRMKLPSDSSEENQTNDSLEIAPPVENDTIE
jgi:monofunctional biosynthetic peptidoglycan transglycosylase